jgi:hypothetical protein
MFPKQNIPKPNIPKPNIPKPGTSPPKKPSKTRFQLVNEA